MARGCVTITVRTEFEQAQADGSKCLACGDQIFLTAYQVVLYNADTGTRMGGSDSLLCQSCGKVLKQRCNDAR